MVTPTSKEKNTASTLDRVLWVLVFGIVVFGIWANGFYRDDIAIVFRALGLIALALIAGYILFQTERGRNLWILIRDARSEIRRVIWPTRPETLQTTMIVLIMILIFALILWALDSGLSFLTSLILGA